MTRRIPLVLLAAALVAGLLAATAHAGDSGDVGDRNGDGGIASITPGSGPPGTEVTYTITGNAGAEDACRGSSAFATELLGGDGARVATGADAVVVPDTATPGPAFLRLICYLPDDTGRPVIHQSCVSLEVTEPGSAPGAPASAPEGEVLEDPCPPSGRVLVSKGVIDAQTRLGTAFNRVIAPLGG